MMSPKWGSHHRTIFYNGFLKIKVSIKSITKIPIIIYEIIASVFSFILLQSFKIKGSIIYISNNPAKPKPTTERKQI